MEDLWIRAAVVGPGNVGKSTTINAIIRNTITEVSDEDCTKTIQCFDLHGPSQNGLPPKAAALADALNKSKKLNASVNQDDLKKETMNHIKVKVKSDMFEMHHGLRMRVLDCPDLDTYPQYKEWLRKREFEVLICLVDVTVASNCRMFKEQQNIIQLVKEVVDASKPYPLPVIIGINKRDDPNDEDTTKRVAKWRSCINEIFAESNDGVSEDNAPVVVDFSAKAAFTYYKMNEVNSAEELAKTVSKGEILKIVESVLGLQGAAELCDDTLLAEKAFEATRINKVDYAFKHKLEATGFPALMAALRSIVQGEKRQGHLMSEKLRKLQDENEPEQAGDVFTVQFGENLKRQLSFSNETASEENFRQYQEFYARYLELKEKELLNSPHNTYQLVFAFAALQDFDETVAPLLISNCPDGSLAESIEKWTQFQLTGLLKVQLGAVSTMASKYTTEVEEREGRPENWEHLTCADWMLNTGTLIRSLNLIRIKEDAAFQEAVSELETLAETFRRPALTLGASGTSFDWTTLSDGIKVFLDKKQENKTTHLVEQVVNRTLATSFASIQQDLKTLREGLLLVNDDSKKISERFEECFKSIEGQVERQAVGIKRKLAELIKGSAEEES